MRSLADFEFNKAPLCEGMILACEAIRRDFPSQDVYDELERLVSLAKEEISQLLNAEELNHKDTPVKLENTGITLNHVSFSYDGTTEVLHDVNLAMQPGTMTALVGPSGSGKSTVAKLIAGYWDVTSGSITLGGHELKDMPLSEIADQISYVSQDNYLFNRSIRENIRMGRPGATDAEVEQAAKQSGCDAFIRKLDNGYDTVVGSAGSHLSGGERQRIAIARSVYSVLTGELD